MYQLCVSNCIWSLLPWCMHRPATLLLPPTCLNAATASTLEQRSQPRLIVSTVLIHLTHNTQQPTRQLHIAAQLRTQQLGLTLLLLLLLLLLLQRAAACPATDAAACWCTAARTRAAAVAAAGAGCCQPRRRLALLLLPWGWRLLRLLLLLLSTAGPVACKHKAQKRHDGFTLQMQQPRLCGCNGT
jgi:hypothetical protein